MVRQVPLAPRWLRYAAVALVAATVLGASVVRPAPGPDRFLLGVGFDKWLHAAGYAALAASLGYARLPAGGRLSTRALVGVALVSLAFGVGVELVQGPLPYRSLSAADAAADAVGAVAGALPFRVVAGADDADAGDPKALSPSTGKEGQ
ncbi:VanZ family protein [Halorarius halobius]|uniref:VanZ family protein n=1 Tax=Halorarius halobius TaxID=2962671 RepID=UPI0020CB90A1|nr:VanZ family protein [Halorarius halobius]